MKYLKQNCSFYLTLFLIILISGQYLYFFLEKKIWMIIAYNLLDFLYHTFNINDNYFSFFSNSQLLGQFIASSIFGIVNFLLINYVRKYFIFKKNILLYLLFILVCLTVSIQYDVDDNHRCLWVHSCWTGL